MQAPVLKARRAVSVSPDQLVTAGRLESGSTVPWVIQPAMPDVHLVDWAAASREYINNHLLEYGALLFRGFRQDSPAEFETFIAATAGATMEYHDCATPRHRVEGGIYTSTDYPADQTIELHNENAYSHTWPMKIYFMCVTPAAEGGETPIADSREIFQRIHPAVRDRAIARKLMYVRNFGDGFGPSWQQLFQTSDKAVVEERCRRAGIEVTWKGGDRLQTRLIRPAALRHPVTNEDVWFNQATAFHVSTLPAAVREPLLARLSEDELPKNVYYGDGGAIEAEVLEELRRAYREETRRFAWHRGDILMLDNMLMAHGRCPYRGARQVLCGMGEPMSAHAPLPV
jgi:alpha-ketoglutarate-dependent taurine dioxygenase